MLNTTEDRASNATGRMTGGLRKLYDEHQFARNDTTRGLDAFLQNPSHTPDFLQKMEVSEEASLTTPTVPLGLKFYLKQRCFYACVRGEGMCLYSPDLQGVSEYSFRSSFHALEMLSSMTYQVSEDVPHGSSEGGVRLDKDLFKTVYLTPLGAEELAVTQLPETLDVVDVVKKLL